MAARRSALLLQGARKCQSRSLAAAARSDSKSDEKESGQLREGDDASLGPINKRPIDLNPRTYAYLLANTREHEVLRRCREGESPFRASKCHSCFSARGVRPDAPPPSPRRDGEGARGPHAGHA